MDYYLYIWILIFGSKQLLSKFKKMYRNCTMVKMHQKRTIPEFKKNIKKLEFPKIIGNTNNAACPSVYWQPHQAVLSAFPFQYSFVFGLCNVNAY